MITIERDRSGRTYQIWRQQQQSSCGVACAWMARGIARQMSINEDEWTLATRIYAGAVASVGGLPGPIPQTGPMTFNPAAFGNHQRSMGATFANFGLFTGQLAAALRGERLVVEHAHNNGRALTVQPNKIAINRPGIALVRWDAGGGHFVVIGRAVPSNISFLDPWNGRVNEQPNDGRYQAAYNNIGTIVEILYISA